MDSSGNGYHPWDSADRSVWQKYCGFLSLSEEDFKAVQESLLLESLEIMGRSPWGRSLMGGTVPLSVEEFRESAPLTTYEDYAPVLDLREENYLSFKPYSWAYTTTSRGGGKWSPYSQRAYDNLTDGVFSSVILAAARGEGEINIKHGDKGIYNIAPKPYISGYVAQGLVEKFGFKSIPPLELAEKMDFRERIEAGFEMALRTGVDIMCSLSSVLLKMGQRFAEHSQGGGFKGSRLHPAVLYRFSRALLSSKASGRGIMPRDLWPLKALIGWGLDTSLYGSEIVDYWGAQPYEFHACTEVGILAQQSWNKRGLTPSPYAAFLEYLPEDEIGKIRRDPDHRPRTVLVDELVPGRRYEVVLSSFYGMPFLRYRVGHLIKVLSLGDPETGVSLPQISFVGRTDEAIDLAGFTRLDEKTIWEALAGCPFQYEDWTIRKENPGGSPSLHLLIEVRDRLRPQEVEEVLHQGLRGVDPGYRDLEDMIGLKPLEVTLLPRGTFERYAQEMRRRGLDPSQWRVGHLNAPQARINELLDMAS